MVTAGLSPSTAHHVHAVLHRALADAVRWGLVSRNVAGLVPAPRMAEHQMQTLSGEQARPFLEAAQGDRFEALYVLAISTGMRQGELLALRWQDVDLVGSGQIVPGTLRRSKGTLTIAEPKTLRSGGTARPRSLSAWPPGLCGRTRTRCSPMKAPPM